MQAWTFSFGSLPHDAAEMRANPVFDPKDPAAMAACAVAALCRFPVSREACYEMLDLLKGPQPLTEIERQFIRDRFMDGKEYVIRSYFRGAVPSNDYTPEFGYTVCVSEGAHSDDQLGEGYKVLYLTSGGADSPREIKMRTKRSTGEWFVWEFGGILSGVRVPESADPWA